MAVRWAAARNARANRTVEQIPWDAAYSESISSMKTTAGSIVRAVANIARTSFSPSPIHFDVSEDELMLKKVDSHLRTCACPRQARAGTA